MHGVSRDNGDPIACSFLPLYTFLRLFITLIVHFMGFYFTGVILGRERILYTTHIHADGKADGKHLLGNASRAQFNLGAMVALLM